MRHLERGRGPECPRDLGSQCFVIDNYNAELRFFKKNTGDHVCYLLMHMCWKDRKVPPRGHGVPRKRRGWTLECSWSGRGPEEEEAREGKVNSASGRVSRTRR